MKSVSELAKLVTSGRLHVPKSLVHYVDDRAQLLDQIFTILSPSDVKGMKRKDQSGLVGQVLQLGTTPFGGIPQNLHLRQVTA